MTLPRSARLAACFSFCLVVLSAAAQAPAADPKWNPSRNTAPEDIAELKSLQESVKSVVDKCTPATVALLFGNSTGSGVIVSEDGLVLTAAHVIRDYKAPAFGRMEGEAQPFTSGKSITIMLPSGKRVQGKTLGINAGDDSGMVQITDKGPNDGKWPFQPIGKSGALKKGQWVVALGHPNGPKEGRIPVARLGRVQETTKNSIRTDCPVVGGDSGGPLFDLNGNVIGITSRIGLPLSQNIHVQSDRFKDKWDAMLAGDWIDKPATQASAYLGVVFPDNEEEDAWLREVEEGAPAEKAGLKPGDTITKFNSTVVKSVKQFRDLMSTAKPGAEVRLTVRRGTTIVVSTVKLGRRDA